MNQILIILQTQSVVVGCLSLNRILTTLACWSNLDDDAVKHHHSQFPFSIIAHNWSSNCYGLTVVDHPQWISSCNWATAPTIWPMDFTCWSIDYACWFLASGCRATHNCRLVSWVVRWATIPSWNWSKSSSAYRPESESWFLCLV